MKKALIVKYTENNVEYWGYYYKDILMQHTLKQG